jgi:hypothetical protein
MMSLLHDSAARREMIGRAQQKLRESYTHDILRRQVENVFDEALKVAVRHAATANTALC